MLDFFIVDCVLVSQTKFVSKLFFRSKVVFKKGSTLSMTQFVKKNILTLVLMYFFVPYHVGLRTFLMTLSLS